MSKLQVLLFLFISIFVVLLIRLFYIQVVAADKFYANNYLRTQRIVPERGLIFDRNKQPLALNQTIYRLFVEPKQIKDKDLAIGKIDSILHIGEATLSAKIKSDKVWIPIVSNISPLQKKELEKLSVKGIGFEQESKRFYPEASVAAQLLGFVGKNEDADTLGYFGIEGYYDKDLVGLPGLVKTERDVLGKPIFVGIQDVVHGEDGRNLILSIDKTVQLIAKQKLKAGIERYQAKEGCIIVADPSSGEIIALSCLPDFDPDRYFDFSEDYYRNPAITTIFEPGSIFKPLVMAAALEEHAVSPDDIYNETGPITIGGYTINTWNDKYEGEITMTRILEKSSNVGMVYVGQKLGNDKLLKYLHNYGIGEKTGIDLQGEAAGLFKGEKNWHEIDYSTATFGQGLVVTPIQMVQAFSSLINGGYIMVPHVVKSIVSASGEEKKIGKKIVRRVLTERTSLLMRKMLQNTVEHAEARWKRPVGYKIGGKTGTAQIPVAGHYDPSKTIASFIGFAPVDNPKFIAFVMLKEPATSPWGSETAAPLFFEVARELLVYYNVPPE